MEVSLASDMSHIEDLVQCLAKHTADPHCLPTASEQVIKDVKGIDYSTIVAFKVIGGRWKTCQAENGCLDTAVVAGVIEFTQIERLLDQ